MSPVRFRLALVPALGFGFAAAFAVALALAGLPTPALAAGPAASGAPAPASVDTVGKPVAEQDVAPFHRLLASGRTEIILRQGDREHLTVERLPDEARVTARVDVGTLYVEVDEKARGWFPFSRQRDEPARLAVWFRKLDRIGLSGVVRLRAPALVADSLAIDASGGTQLTLDGLRTRLLTVDASAALQARLAGAATEQRLTVSGAADYDASRLVSETVSIDISGAGQARLNVSRELRADVSGAASIDYTGAPTVHSDVSGAGRIRRVTPGS
jgi:hypothetical protein